MGTATSAAARLVSAVALLAVGLFGIWLLNDTIKIVLWLIFLIVSYPVITAFISSVIDGVQFSSADLISLYRESLRSIPILSRFLPPK